MLWIQQARSIHLFVARDAKLDVYGPLASSPSWTDDWQSIDSDSLWHPMIVSKNNGMLYGGAGRYVFSIEQKTGQTFAPGTSATYDFTVQALDLPSSYRIKCLTELGNNLMIGTWKGTNIYDYRVADIYPWDRSSTSFGQPIMLDENGINGMISNNGLLYIMAGVDGKIYCSNGVQAWVVAQVPESVVAVSGTNGLTPFPGAIMYHNSKIYFGVGATSAVGGCGVWSLKQMAKGNILNIEHLIDTDNSGATNPLQIGALCAVTREKILVGWRDGST